MSVFFYSFCLFNECYLHHLFRFLVLNCFKLHFGFVFHLALFGFYICFVYAMGTFIKNEWPLNGIYFHALSVQF